MNVIIRRSTRTALMSLLTLGAGLALQFIAGTTQRCELMAHFHHVLSDLLMQHQIRGP